MKLIYICSRFPLPLDKGDKLRAYFQIQDLSKECDLYLFSLSDEAPKKEDLEHLQSFCKEVHVFSLKGYQQKWKAFWALFTRHPLQVKMFFSRRIQRNIHKHIARIQPDHIFCQLVRTSDYVKSLYGIPKTLDYMDAMSTGMNRLSSESSFPMNKIYSIEGKRLTNYENIIFDYFDQHVIISEQDQNLIYHPDRKRIHVIRNGVDIDRFKSIELHKKHTLIFHGNMNYPPNVKSAQHIANDILPISQKEGHHWSVLISGTNPHPKVKELASENVVIGGWVDDLREAYCSAKVFVAPMLINTGLQNKILEAMSLEIPCVVSSMANNAIGATEDEHLLIANTPEDFVQKIDFLLQNPDEAKAMTQRARQFIVHNYSWKHYNTELFRLIKS